MKPWRTSYRMVWAELATRSTCLWSTLKAGIVQLGQRLGVDFSLTHSCYDPDQSGRPCGQCDSCLLRAKGFEEAGSIDPWRSQRRPPDIPVSLAACCELAEARSQRFEQRVSLSS